MRWLASVICTGCFICSLSEHNAKGGDAANPAPRRPVFHCIEPDQAAGSSAAVVVEDVPLIHTTQVLPLTSTGEVGAKGDIAKQTEQILANARRVLRSAGSDLDRIVKLNLYVAREELVPAVRKAIAQQLGGPARRPPAVSFVVSALPDPQALVGLDVVATAERRGQSGVEFYTPAGNSTGIQSLGILPPGPKLYVSGMADTNSLAVATHKTLEKLMAAAKHLGSDKSDIVQLKMFLQPMTEVAKVRQAVVEFFSGRAPPVIFVEWISLAPNPPIEIELIARAHGDFSSEPDPITFLTPPGTTSTRVFSRVARVNRGRLVYASGLYGKGSGSMSEMRDIFASLGELLKKSGSDFGHLVKATYYVSNEDASNALNAIRPEFFLAGRAPAASKAKVHAVGPQGGTVTLDMIAIAP